jgi:cellulose synthase/poly-beta-1,6-N-acetylglucosamine synthase-like glycosyltransferase
MTYAILLLVSLIAVVLTLTTIAGAIAFLKGKELKIQPIFTGEYPTVSVVIPTYNEAGRIGTKLENLLRQDYPIERLEIVVVDNSTDETPSIIEGIRRQNPDREIVFHHEEARRGLADALHTGYSIAKGSVVIKSDCDANLLGGNAIKTAVGYLQRADVGAVTGMYVPHAVGEAGYRTALHRLQVAESNIDSVPIAHGAFLAFRKKLYRGIDPNSLADDTEVMIDIRLQGYKTLVVPAITFVEDHPAKLNTAIRQRARRARGILRLYASGAKGMMLNPKFGLFGLGILPLEFALMVILPLASVLSIFIGAYLIIVDLSFVGLALDLSLCIIVWVAISHLDSMFSGIVVSQISSILGFFELILPQSGVYEKTRDESSRP